MKWIVNLCHDANVADIVKTLGNLGAERIHVGLMGRRITFVGSSLFKGMCNHPYVESIVISKQEYKLDENVQQSH